MICCSSSERSLIVSIFLTLAQIASLVIFTILLINIALSFLLICRSSLFRLYRQKQRFIQISFLFIKEPIKISLSINNINTKR